MNETPLIEEEGYMWVPVEETPTPKYTPPPIDALPKKSIMKPPRQVLNKKSKIIIIVTVVGCATLLVTSIVLAVVLSSKKTPKPSGSSSSGSASSSASSSSTTCIQRFCDYVTRQISWDNGGTIFSMSGYPRTYDGYTVLTWTATGASGMNPVLVDACEMTYKLNSPFYSYFANVTKDSSDRYLIDVGSHYAPGADEIFIIQPASGTNQWTIKSKSTNLYMYPTTRTNVAVFGLRSEPFSYTIIPAVSPCP